jgi:hypothetical protein
VSDVRYYYRSDFDVHGFRFILGQQEVTFYIKDGDIKTKRDFEEVFKDAIIETGHWGRYKNKKEFLQVLEHNFEDCWKSIKEWAKVLLDKTDPWKDRIERMKA